jgi:hypothetical protein
MEREFANANRHDDDESGSESESDGDSVASAPSCADLYSDPGESSDDDSLSETKSSDVEDTQDVAIEILDSPVKSQPVDV